ncbi:PTS system, cellobiose-specific IIB component [Thermoanaerobacter thermohydrosulfuricus]|uniref:Phosphotransferase system lactose/cellobiose-specific IIB subunit n=2 Tax=Thermoanaerobacter TaxID=1754 RepID=D3T6J9_THEIA|nr:MULTISPECIES: PTS sugar transporter subunit IIB [Thermoanaerobacter]ADD01612.1 phosphotransferase system lactose/cellobiose-specific IIB subunit [Thermoanaerobacter italicus Ab9]SDF42494.1 PTS system, cellobiose-specific IIB component [Thermoanaerobacter thermohydrosulfuricus]
MKILLVCAAGMSTSLLVEKMKKAVKPEYGEVIINAVPIDQFEEVVKDYDVVLLGPQIRYKQKDFEKITNELGIPMEVINIADYGMVRGDKVLELALKLVKDKKKEN